MKLPKFNLELPPRASEADKAVFEQIMSLELQPEPKKKRAKKAADK